MLVAGIDIGASRIRCVLLDLDAARVLGSCAGEGASPTATEPGVFTGALRRCASKCLGGATRAADLVAVSSTGVGGRPDLPQLVASALSPLGVPPEAIELIPDFVAAHASIFLLGPGVVYIAGTGSVAYGVCRGRAVRVGGWGHLLGDEGSAYQVGRDALAAVLRAWDGRGRVDGELMDEVKRFFNVSTPEDLVLKVYSSANPKLLIASFAPRVVELARRGVVSARRIVGAAAREAALAIVAALTRLGCRGIEVGVVGGFYEGARDILDPLILKELRSAGYSGVLRRPVVRSECAALLIAVDRRVGRARAEELSELLPRVCRA